MWTTELYFNTWAHLAASASSNVTPAILAALIIYVKFQTPLRRMRVILALFRCFSRKIAPHTKASPFSRSDVASDIPKTMSSIISHYNLDPACCAFVCCPHCYCITALTPKALEEAETEYNSGRPLPTCTNKDYPGSPNCGTQLWCIHWINSRAFVVPIQKQIFQDLKEWMGRLLAIPGIEDIMAAHHQGAAPEGSPVSSDFRDSPTYRNFKGFDGQPFMQEQQSPSGAPDLRLIMSLGMDAFQTFGPRHPHGSSTALYMVLLALPEHLRYKQQYMYLVTVLPGKPTRHYTNHTLKWLATQLLLFWKGVFYRRTARHQLGRTVFIALIPGVGDTEGAHQMSGFISHNQQNFCIRCYLPIQEIENLNPETWPRRDPQKHRAIALQWLNSNEADRNLIFKTHGLRWSDLLILPYWDPISFTVIDDMHMGYLGLLRTHIESIWQVDGSIDGGEGHPVLTSKHVKPPNKVLRNLWDEIRRNLPGLRQALLDLTVPSLWYLCFYLGLRSVGNKQTLVTLLIDWVSAWLRCTSQI